MEQKQLCLGNTVEDEVTGLTGIIVQEYRPMSAARQFAIQPRGDGTTVPDPIMVDEYLLKFVGHGIAGRTPPPEAEKFKYGQEVREFASGQFGVIVAISTHLNGCVHYGITTTSRANRNPEIFYVNQNRLELKGEGVTEKVKPTEAKTPGGPNVRANTMKPR